MNLHSFRRRANAFEKTTWAEISSPVVRVHETFGTHEPKTSHIVINEPASSGTCQRIFCKVRCFLLLDLTTLLAIHISVVLFLVHV